MHEDHTFTLKMGKSNYKRAPDFEFREESEVHQLWTISRYQTKKLESAAEKCDQFHLADGHHRLASTQKWGTTAERRRRTCLCSGK